MPTPDPSTLHRYKVPTKERLADYEVRPFFDIVCPGLKQVQIADILGVSRQQIGNYIRDGMPANVARSLLAWRTLEITRLAAEITEIKNDFEL